MSVAELTGTAELIERSNNLRCPQQLYPEANSIAEILRLRARNQADDIAFIYLSSTDAKDALRTYREFDRRAGDIAYHLHDLGLAEGAGEPARVILAYPPCADFADAFFGALYAGVTAVNAFVPTTDRESAKLGAIAADCRASAVLTHSSSIDEVKATLAAAGFTALPIIATDVLNSPPAMREGYFADSQQNDECFIQYTSGSTSNPKGVRVKHSNLLHNLSVIEQHMEGAHGDRYLGLGWLPVFHDMGLIACLNYPIFIGRPNILFSHQVFAQRPNLWMSRISEFGATHTAGPNFAYELCAKIARRAAKGTLDLSSLKVALCGAEPLRADTLERFALAYADCGLDPLSLAPAYGLAEATLMVTGTPAGGGPRYLEADQEALREGHLKPTVHNHKGSDNLELITAKRRLVSSGQINQMHAVRIVNTAAGAQVTDGTVGEIWVDSESVADGYLNMPTSSDDHFNARLIDGSGPFLRTGDLGFIDDGHLYVTGREKDIIILNGANHHASDIEAAIDGLGLAAIRRSVAFAVTDGAGREAVTILCEVRTAARQDEMEALTIDIANALFRSEGFAAGVIALVPKGAIPRTSSGKLQRSLARKKFYNGTIESYFEYRNIRFAK